MLETNTHSRYELYWLAGIIEGEGSFSLKKSGSIAIALSSTDKDVIERIVRYSGQGAVHGPYTQKGRVNNKEIWSWWLYGPKAVGMMLVLRRLMSNRRQTQIDKCLAGYKKGKYDG